MNVPLVLIQNSRSHHLQEVVLTSRKIVRCGFLRFPSVVLIAVSVLDSDEIFQTHLSSLIAHNYSQ